MRSTHLKTHHLETELWLPRPLDEVFAFFSAAHHLDAITPPWLHFRTLTPGPVVLRAGTLIDYQLRLHGVPVRWRSEITAWEPPVRFVDEQRKGPYRLWVHEHTFEARDGGTAVRDHVTYAVPGGPLEPLIHRLLVAPGLAKIFSYRQKRIQELLL